MTSATMTMGRDTLPRTGLGLVLVGCLLLAWGGWNLLKPERGPLHQYQLEKSGNPADFPALPESLPADLAIRQFTVRVESEARPVAQAYVAERGGERTLLQWENQLAEPFLYLQGNVSELTEVAAAIDKYADPETPILAWWDEWRRLELLSERVSAAPVHRPGSQFLPAVWLSEREYADAVETVFWSTNTRKGDSEALYAAFQESLLKSEEEAVHQLRELAEGGKLLVVVNAADAYKLGVTYPDRFGIGFKDFADTGNLHGTIERVKNWLQEQNRHQYFVQRLDDNRVRAYYLTDEKSQQALISSLLPFSGRGHIHLKQFDLVFQKGSYWVFQVK